MDNLLKGKIFQKFKQVANKEGRRQKEAWREPGSNVQPSDYEPDALSLIYGGLMVRRVKSGV